MSGCPNCRDHIEDLQEEVRQLRELAFGQTFMPHPKWALTGTESSLLQLLIARDVVTLESFEGAMRAKRWDWDAGEKLFHVMVCKLRKKLGVYGVEITTLWGMGYSLQPTIKAAVKLACEGGSPLVGEPIEAPRERSITADVLAFIAAHPEGVTSGMVAEHFRDRSSGPAMLGALAERGLLRRWRPAGLKRGYIYYPLSERAA